MSKSNELMNEEMFTLTLTNNGLSTLAIGDTIVEMREHHAIRTTSNANKPFLAIECSILTNGKEEYVVVPLGAFISKPAGRHNAGMLHTDPIFNKIGSMTAKEIIEGLRQCVPFKVTGEQFIDVEGIKLDDEDGAFTIRQLTLERV